MIVCIECGHVPSRCLCEPRADALAAALAFFAMACRMEGEVKDAAASTAEVVRLASAMRPADVARQVADAVVRTCGHSEMLVGLALGVLHEATAHRGAGGGMVLRGHAAIRAVRYAASWRNNHVERMTRDVMGYAAAAARRAGALAGLEAEQLGVPHVER